MWRDVLKLLCVLSLLLACMLALHMLLNIETRPLLAVRRWYLWTPHPKPNMSFLIDVILPGVITGAVLRRIGIKGGLIVWMSAASTGLVLSLAALLYPYVTTFDIWWLAPTNPDRFGLVRFHGVVAAIWCAFILSVPESVATA